jgi:hypothetical protein
MSAVVVENRIFQALADPNRRAIFELPTRCEAAVKHYKLEKEPWSENQ